MLKMAIIPYKISQKPPLTTAAQSTLQLIVSCDVRNDSKKNSNKWKLLENLCLVSGNHLNGAIDNIKKANRFILNSFTK